MLAHGPGGATISRWLEFCVRLTHSSIFDERFIDDLGRQFDLAGFFQAGRPEECLIKSLPDGKTAVSAQHDDLVVLEGFGNLVRHLRCA